MAPIPPPTFTSFHTRTTQEPLEITSRIIYYAGPYASLLGYPGARHASVACVSSAFREAYLGQKSGFDFNGKRPVPYGRIQKRDQQFCRRPLDTRPTIREALNFTDLQTLVRFFTDGPGRRDSQAITFGQCLADITYIRIVYRDDWAVPNWEYNVRYAYEAFELLVANFDRMRLRRLQIHVTSYTPSFNVDSPGVWSLLKIRGLQTAILTSRPGEICPAVRRALKERLCWPGSEPWRPIGLENPGPDDWLAHVGRLGQAEEVLRSAVWGTASRASTASLAGATQSKALPLLKIQLAGPALAQKPDAPAVNMFKQVVVVLVIIATIIKDVQKLGGGRRRSDDED
ncbi:hypothetical protein IFR05_016684 [Cadophora sp. M221]|nr:hypothetical protein IFR05_016684 [Cadophora sp. M221]